MWSKVRAPNPSHIGCGAVARLSPRKRVHFDIAPLIAEELGRTGGTVELQLLYYLSRILVIGLAIRKYGDYTSG